MARPTKRGPTNFKRGKVVPVIKRPVAGTLSKLTSKAQASGRNSKL